MAELSEHACGEPSSQTQPTVLVVDNDVRILRLIAAMLDAEGYRVLKAGGPEEAVRIFEQQPTKIDLLLSDVRMPGMSGPELETRLHEVKPGLPVIFMTGYAPQVASPDRVLEKPFGMQALCKKVASAIGDSAPPVMDRSWQDQKRS